MQTTVVAIVEFIDWVDSAEGMFYNSFLMDMLQFLPETTIPKHKPTDSWKNVKERIKANKLRKECRLPLKLHQMFQPINFNFHI